MKNINYQDLPSLYINRNLSFLSLEQILIVYLGNNSRIKILKLLIISYPLKN